jgi:5'-3' exonuclease
MEKEIQNTNSENNFKTIKKRSKTSKDNKNDNTIMLIDSSYTSFYRFYATQTWFSKAYPDEYKEIQKNEDYDWFQNDIFMEKYKKMFFSSFDKTRKLYKIKTENMIFAFDCPRNEIWRNKHFETYKSNRDCDKHKKGNIGEVFKFTYNIIFPSLESIHNVKTIKVDKAEADDVIAVIKKNLRNNYPKLQIVIITNDYDYLQLADEYTSLINLKGKLITEKSKGDPKKDLLNKIICGDPSDCIPGVFKKFGEKTLQKYFDTPGLLEEKLNSCEESRKKYEFNKMMIDFDYIPNDIQNNIIKKYNELNMNIEYNNENK